MQNNIEVTTASLSLIISEDRLSFNRESLTNVGTRLGYSREEVLFVNSHIELFYRGNVWRLCYTEGDAIREEWATVEDLLDNKQCNTLQRYALNQYFVMGRDILSIVGDIYKAYYKVLGDVYKTRTDTVYFESVGDVKVIRPREQW